MSSRSYLVVLFQIVDALYVCTERDAVFVKYDFATGECVEVFNPLRDKDALYLLCDTLSEDISLCTRFSPADGFGCLSVIANTPQ